MDNKSIYDYLVEEEATFKTMRVPITTSKDWNMHEHIERCTNVANAWFHSGANDGNRPYHDIVTPILNVAIRSEGFDVKDIVPFVNDADNYYKSFLIKKYHPQWARKNEIDTFIDDLVESSAIYGLSLVKHVNQVKPEVVPLQSIAFCDQTDILSGPLCLKHQYSIADLLEFKGKWDDNKIDEAITMAKASKVVSMSNDQEAKTPGKYVEVYELHGMLPEFWLKDGGDKDVYANQLHIITYYKSADGKKNGITLFKGKENKSIFKALKIDRIKSFGRACGKSLIETLFEPQVWANYDAIQIKKLLDAAAIVLFQSDSDELGNQKLSNLKVNTVIKHETGKPIVKMDTTVPNVVPFSNDQISKENSARTLGSANDAQLGISPTSGTPFKLQDLVVQQGQGIHQYIQGKITTFMADQIYRDWVLKDLVKEMNGGKKFSEELTLDELSEIADKITSNEIEKRIKKSILETGNVPTNTDRDLMKEEYKKEFLSKGSRRFFEIMKGELDKLPIEVYINITGKQRNMVKNADSITKIIMAVLANPQGFVQVPGIAKAFNELIEESGFSPIDFAGITKAPVVEQPKENVPGVGGAKEIIPVK